tara:strand:- start:66822 stop:67241 length:420 start_codon:yes stop_codon:yes gene_type:complete
MNHKITNKTKIALIILSGLLSACNTGSQLQWQAPIGMTAQQQQIERSRCEQVASVAYLNASSNGQQVTQTYVNIENSTIVGERSTTTPFQKGMREAQENQLRQQELAAQSDRQRALDNLKTQTFNQCMYKAGYILESIK